MKIFIKIISTVLLSILIQSNEVKLAAEVLSPFHYENELIGISTDIMDETKKDLVYNKTKVYPWKRAV